MNKRRYGPKEGKPKNGRAPRKDYYYYKAKKESYAARSIFKLEQMDQKYGLFKNGMRVLDLGCHPGSWLQYVSRKIGNSGMAVGIDRTETILLLPNVRNVTADIYELTWQTLGEPPHSFDIVMSDMAPNTSGIKSVDQLQSAALAERALHLGLTFIKPGGGFVVKVFMGPDEPKLFNEMRLHFEKVLRYKPDASKSNSMEIYLVGLERKEPPEHD